MKQRGVALIQVLLIVAVLSAVATQLSYRQQTSARSAISWLDQKQGLAWLEAVESLGLAELRRHHQSPFPADYWGNWSEEFELEEGGVAMFQLEQLQGRYNLNWLHGDSGIEAAPEQVDRLLEEQGEDASWRERLTGWMSAAPGADLEYQARTPGYRSSGLPVAHRSELILLQDEFIPLSDFNTNDWGVFLPPSAPIDLMQVNRTTLEAIWPALTDNQWEMLDSLRSDDELDTPEDWLDSEAFEAGEENGELEKPPVDWFTVGNQYYRFRSVIEFRDRLYWQTSWIYRTTGGKLQVFQRHRMPFVSPLTSDNGTPTE